MKNKLEQISPRIMAIPAWVFLIFFSIVPLIYVVSSSLTNSTLAQPFKDFIWFNNYKQAILDENFGRSLLNTFLFAFVVTSLETLLGFLLAYAVRGIRGLSTLLRSIALLPMFTPPVAVSMIWKLIYDPNSGLMNHYLMQWGITKGLIAFLGDSKLAFPSIMFADIWQWTPFCFILCYAALQALPKAPFEAAEVDGASGWTVFKRLTLPLVLPQVIVVFLFKLLISLKVFDLVYMLTFGGPGNITQVASFYIYRVAFKQFNTGYAAALSFLMLLIITIIATLVIKGREFFMRRSE
ncbi:MAG: sugar ABC transporter permease [Anaerolineaceae bacterium]|nr:MAG: sugar ABC transporter permease [Anaerolineaceae bacterium]